MDAWTGERVRDGHLAGGARSGVLAKFVGAKERARLGVRVGAREHGWVTWYYVHAEGSGLGGDSPGPWPCHWHARITQRRRVGELEPKTVFFGQGVKYSGRVLGLSKVSGWIL